MATLFVVAIGGKSFLALVVPPAIVVARLPAVRVLAPTIGALPTGVAASHGVVAVGREPLAANGAAETLGLGHEGS